MTVSLLSEMLVSDDGELVHGEFTCMLSLVFISTFTIVPT